MSLSPAEINAIADALAPRIISDIKDRGHDFWIDPESHYLDHKDWRTFKKELTSKDIFELSEIVRLYRATKSLWFKAFLGMAIVGGALFVAISTAFGKWH